MFLNLKLVNIIKIKYTYLKNRSSSDIEVYKGLISRIQYIIDRIDIDEEENWFIEYNQLKDEIETNPPEKPISQENKNLIDEINNLFNIKVRKEMKPKEFIFFIIEKYPYYCYDKTKDTFKDLSCEKILEEIFSLYHPDNYSNREDFPIYNEIYMLLGKIKDDEDYYRDDAYDKLYGNPEKAEKYKLYLKALKGAGFKGKIRKG